MIKEELHASSSIFEFSYFKVKISYKSYKAYAARNKIFSNNLNCMCECDHAYRNLNLCQTDY